MLNLNNIIKIIEINFPYQDACAWDFIGLQIKSQTKTNINKILVCLDITNDILQQAIKNKIELIICHHPLIFASNINNINISSWKQKLYQEILKQDINVYVLHTNFDSSVIGMNMLIAQELEIENTLFVNPEKMIVVGNLKTQSSIMIWIEKLKQYFNIKNIQLIGDKTKIIHKVALSAGAGGDSIEKLDNDIDVLITGEMKWNHIIEANDRKMNVIILGHYMEQKFIDFIYQFLVDKLPIKLVIMKSYFKNPIVYF